MKATLKVIAIITACMLTSCEEVSQFTNIIKSRLGSIHLSAPKPLAPEMVDILCDSSLGSTCNESSLKITVARVVEYLVNRPGSHLRVWTMGLNIGQTVVVDEVVSPPKPKKRKGRQKALSSWVRDATAQLLNSMSPKWQSPAPHRTPLAESLSKVGTAENYGSPRRLIVITDGREYRIGNFECRPPGLKRWQELLRRHGALSPKSLSDVVVEFTFVTMPPIKGCSVSLSREKHIQKLWHVALEAAGAQFSMTTGPAQLTATMSDNSEENQNTEMRNR